jgi:putative glutamine amidotransferase
VKRAVLTCRDLKRAAPYCNALRGAGVEPVIVTPDQPIESLDGMGLVLAGGTDVNPAVYGAATDPRSETPDTPRDEMEQRLLREALAADLPVLAICRGLQLFNVIHAGGTLAQHIDGHKLANNETHDGEIYENTQLARVLGAGVLRVNSRHHQAVAEVGAGLKVSSKSPDGVIEGLERPDLRFAVAVQWHPEDMLEKFRLQRRLFAEFAKYLEAAP